MASKQKTKKRKIHQCELPFDASGAPIEMKPDPDANEDGMFVIEPAMCLFGTFDEPYVKPDPDGEPADGSMFSATSSADYTAGCKERMEKAVGVEHGIDSAEEENDVDGYPGRGRRKKKRTHTISSDEDPSELDEESEAQLRVLTSDFRDITQRVLGARFTTDLMVDIFRRMAEELPQ